MTAPDESAVADLDRVPVPPDVDDGPAADGFAGADAPAEAQEEGWDELVAFAVQAYGMVRAAQTGDDLFSIPEPEARLVADPMGRLLERWFPDLDPGPEAQAVAAVIGVIGRRELEWAGKRAERDAARAAEARERAAEDGGAPRGEASEP